MSSKIFESKVKINGEISFPSFLAEKIYMEPFFQKDGLPKHLKRWQETVDKMLSGITTDLPIYLMVDQDFVKEGNYHRRPGLHIDGYWVPEAGHKKHSSSGLYEKEMILSGGHGGRHKPAEVAGGHGGSRHKPSEKAGGHGGSRHKPSISLADSWENASFSYPEALILASNITASKGYEGRFEGIIKDKGSCDEVRVDHLNEIIMEANKSYVGNVTFLHESLKVQKDCYRTLVRLNVPGYSF